MGSNSKWFLCFRAPATIEIDIGSEDGAVDCSADTVLTYIAAAQKKCNKHHHHYNKNKSAESPLKKTRTVTSVVDTRKDGRSSLTNNNLPRKSFISSIKSVLFGSHSSKKSSRETKFPDGSLLKSMDRTSTVSINRHTAIDDDIQNYALARVGTKTATPTPEPDASYASAVADDRSSPPRTSSDGSDWGGNGSDTGRRRRGRGGDHDQEERSVDESGFRMNHQQAVCLVLLSLWVTVFWGRFLAVMLTTVGIYAWESRTRASALLLASLRNKNHNNSNKSRKAAEKKQEEEEVDEIETDVHKWKSASSATEPVR